MPIGRTLLPIQAGSSTSTRGIYFKDNSTGEISDVANISSLGDPSKIPFSDDDYYMASVGFFHIVAIKNYVSGTGGELWVWGREAFGSMGGSTSYQWSRIGANSDWTWVAASGYSSYAIRAGRLYVTGEGTNGELGNGTSDISTFTQIGSDTDWEKVAAGERFALAIKGGDLYSTGINTDYRTGLGTNAGNTTTWTLVDNTETWYWIAAGRRSGIATTTGGKLFTWGSNDFGMTGQGTTTGDTTTPTQVTGLGTSWLYCDCGNYNSYAIKTDGTLWGSGLGSGASVWGTSGITSTFLQDSTSATDWEWVFCNSGNVVFARKTNGELYASGRAYVNGQTSYLYQLTQFGSSSNWDGFTFGNKFSFAGEIIMYKNS